MNWRQEALTHHRGHKVTVWTRKGRVRGGRCYACGHDLTPYEARAYLRGLGEEAGR